MTRYMRLLAALGALAAAPALAADTSAQAKDRKHENAIHHRMNRREAKKTRGAEATAKKEADQGADATRAGGARAARSYHGVVHSGKKAVHRTSKKAANATK